MLLKLFSCFEGSGVEVIVALFSCICMTEMECLRGLPLPVDDLSDGWQRNAQKI